MGHMILLDEFIKLDVSEEFYKLFEVVIQLGAIMAVVLIYFKTIFPWGFGKSKQDTKKTLNFEFDNTIIVNYADGNQKSYLYEVRKNHILIKDSESENFDVIFDFVVKYPTARKLVLVDEKTKEQQEFSLSFEE